MFVSHLLLSMSQCEMQVQRESIRKDMTLYGFSSKGKDFPLFVFAREKTCQLKLASRKIR